MTKFVALLGIVVMQTALTFASYWYAFGLWPISWTAFFLCAVAQIALISMRLEVEKEHQR